jgi:hypothetical protein
MKMAEHITDPKCRSKKVKKLSDLPNVTDDHTGYIVFTVGFDRERMNGNHRSSSLSGFIGNRVFSFV